VQIRRKARILALQALYEIDSSGHPPEQVLRLRLAEEPLNNSMAEAFLRELVLGVLGHLEMLDMLIQEHAPEWPVPTLAIIDRNILRLAIYEMAARRETPLKVAINEAVELAKVFGNDSSPRFINGVLGTLASKHEQLIALWAERSSGPVPGRPAS